MIRIEVKAEEAMRELRRLAREIEDATPILAEIGELLVQRTKERFAAQRAPDGTPWAPLAARTIERKGHARALLGESGRLSHEIVYQVSKDRLEVGSPLVYAAVHQFGARKGQFGTSKKGRPIPWGDIPARPFLGISREDEADIVAIIREHLQR